MARQIDFFDEFDRLFEESGDVGIALLKLKELGASFMNCLQTIHYKLNLKLPEALELLDNSQAWLGYRKPGESVVHETAGQASYPEPKSLWSPALNQGYLDAFLQTIRKHKGTEPALQEISRLGATYLDALLVVCAALYRDMNGADQLLQSSASYRNRRPVIHDRESRK